MTLLPAATEEDLLRTPDDENFYELVDGEIRASPRGGYRHSGVNVELMCRLARVVDEGRLGDLCGPNTGFRLPGGNVRVPDGTFVARGRFPDESAPDGFCDLAPDLAIEILFSAYSPDLPGWIATGATPEETKGLPIPEPSAMAEYVEVGP